MQQALGQQEMPAATIAAMLRLLVELQVRTIWQQARDGPCSLTCCITQPPGLPCAVAGGSPHAHALSELQEGVRCRPCMQGC